mgnify:CR=1 FL=1|jgi:hypothetical protein
MAALHSQMHSSREGSWNVDQDIKRSRLTVHETFDGLGRVFGFGQDALLVGLSHGRNLNL